MYCLRYLLFLSSLCFSSWASRIPTTKNIFNLNDAQLGSILLVIPVSALLGTVVSGWLVSKFDSREPLVTSFLLFVVSLIGISYVKNAILLIVLLSAFSIFMRVLNISKNAQSISHQVEISKENCRVISCTLEPWRCC